MFIYVFIIKERKFQWIKLNIIPYIRNLQLSCEFFMGSNIMAEIYLCL